jgi:hypothetical protein
MEKPAPLPKEPLAVPKPPSPGVIALSDLIAAKVTAALLSEKEAA